MSHQYQFFKLFSYSPSLVSKYSDELSSNTGRIAVLNLDGSKTLCVSLLAHICIIMQSQNTYNMLCSTLVYCNMLVHMLDVRFKSRKSGVNWQTALTFHFKANFLSFLTILQRKFVQTIINKNSQYCNWTCTTSAIVQVA